MASSIATARANLHAALAANATLTGKTHFGLPAPGGEAQEAVCLLGLADPEESQGVLPATAARSREERYRIVVAVKAYDPAGDAGDVDARGFALADAVRAAVHADRTLGGAVRWAAVVSQTSDGVELAEGGGWVIFIQLQIECHARVA